MNFCYFVHVQIHRICVYVYVQERMRLSFYHWCMSTNPCLCVCVCFVKPGSLIDADGMIDESGCEEMGCRRTDEFVFSACLTEWESEPSFQPHFVLALAPSKLSSHSNRSPSQNY